MGEGSECVLFFGMPAALGSFDLMSQLRVERQGKNLKLGVFDLSSQSDGEQCSNLRLGTKNVLVSVR